MLKIEMVLTRKQLKQFVKLPFTLYKDDPAWVPPLISEQYKFFNGRKNPYYWHSEVQLFIALENDEVVGRISAHTNTQHQKEHNEDIGFFGFFECVNDVRVAKELFKTAAEWNKQRGFAAMRGPMNFSVNQEVGLLIDGFERSPTFMITDFLVIIE